MEVHNLSLVYLVFMILTHLLVPFLGFGLQKPARKTVSLQKRSLLSSTEQLKLPFQYITIILE